MNKGDMVEIVDIDKKDKWLVRNKKNLNQVGLHVVARLPTRLRFDAETETLKIVR